MSVHVSYEGGLFDGGFDADADRVTIELTDTVTDIALDTWRGNLDESIRINRGRYVGQLAATRTSATTAELGDGRSKYGPWLEGTGSRNFPVTRFRGYRSAAAATGQVQPIADQAAEDAAARFVKEQNT